MGLFLDEIRRVLPVAYRVPGDISAFAFGDNLPVSHISTVRHDRGSALAGQPLLPTLLWRVFLQHRFQLSPSSLKRWRRRTREKGLRWLPSETIEARHAAGVIPENSVEAMFVDTT